MLAREIMTKDVITVKREDTVEHVIKLLMEHNVSGLPVVDEENHVVGMITEGDLIYRSKKLQIPSYFTILDSYIFLESTKTIQEQIRKMVGYRVEDVMTEKVISVDVEENIEEIATLMATKKVNRVPITENGKLVGIVSRRDIIKAYADS
ncbi:CBS domain-containing protein [Alkaliphilus crotonatoxidans]